MSDLSGGQDWVNGMLHPTQGHLWSVGVLLQQAVCVCPTLTTGSQPSISFAFLMSGFLFWGSSWASERN